MNIKHVGLVQNGAIQFDDKELWRKQLQSMIGERVQVTIKTLSKHESERSLNQNAYYWGVIVSMARELIGEEYGETLDLETAHETLKEYCNYRESIKGDKVLRITQSTATLTTSEFEGYLTRCREWLFNWFNVVVPLPNEVAE